MNYSLLLLFFLLLTISTIREPFTVHIEGDIFNPLHSISYVKNSIYSWITPAYHGIIGKIPYKHHFRRIRRTM